jgi:diguanylate cyclase (GGDEF)-like protein
MEANVAGLQNKKRPIIGAALVALVLVCLAPVAMQIRGILDSRESELADGQATTSNIARSLAADADSSVKLAAAVLDDVVERVEHDGTEHAAASRLHAMLRNRVTKVPVLQNVFVFGADGQWLVNSLTDPQPLNCADREYFQFHKANEGRKLHLGLPLMSRSTGVWVLPLSRRIDHADGSFAGVAVATIPLSHFNDFYQKFDIGAHGAMMLATDAGRIITRRPGNDALIGGSIAESPVFSFLQNGAKEGSAMLVARIDKVERLYSFRRVDGLPLVVIVGQSKEELLATWSANTRRTCIALAVLIVAMISLGGYVVRQIVIRERLEDSLLASTTQLEAQNAALQVMASSDGLTGLANRRRFDGALETEFGRAYRNGTALALLMIDVDHFKKFNDHYGHLAGDDCLRQVAAAVRGGERRSSDLAARYGGEEFALILPDTDIAGAVAVAERIRVAICGLQIEHARSHAQIVTISVGVHAVWPNRADHTAADLIAAADQQLYAAKSQGRNVVKAGAQAAPAALDPARLY